LFYRSSFKRNFPNETSKVLDDLVEDLSYTILEAALIIENGWHH